MLFAHRASEDQPGERYLVLTAPVQAGEHITSDVLGSVAVDLPNSLDAISEGDSDVVIGRLAKHALEPRTILVDAELIEADRFVEPDETEVTITLDPARTPADGLGAGQVVTVLSTGENGTRTVTPAARVVDIATGDDSAIGNSSGVKVTLAVGDLDEATRVIDTSVSEELSLAIPAPGGPDAATATTGGSEAREQQ